MISKLKNPEDFIDGVMQRVKKEYLQRAYGIEEWKDTDDFVSQFAIKSGRLLKVCFFFNVCSWYL